MIMILTDLIMMGVFIIWHQDDASRSSLRGVARMATDLIAEHGQGLPKVGIGVVFLCEHFYKQ